MVFTNVNSISSKREREREKEREIEFVFVNTKEKREFNLYSCMLLVKERKKERINACKFRFSVMPTSHAVVKFFFTNRFLPVAECLGLKTQI